MLPLGRIGIRSAGGDRYTRFTKDEQITLMTLWVMMRSPLMFGGDLRYNDEWTTSLLTNEEVLRITKSSHSNRQLYCEDDIIAWTAVGEDDSVYLAHFNLGKEAVDISTELSQLGLSGIYLVRDLWAKEDMETTNTGILTNVPAHGAVLMKLTRQEG
jgi:hypothetical protein